ncbi:MAG: DNA gyrase C-terminal beta-propeller domain-containing protein [Puniceicoccales bacterium]
MEDVIANEGCIITISHNGFVKRTAVSSYRSQKRGGKGVIGAGQHDDDFVEHLFTASTHDYIMFFMNNGRVYVEKVYEIPEGTRTSKGRSIVNVLQMQKDEKIASMICIKEFSDTNHLVMCTKKGIVKKTNLAEYQNYRKGGTIGIKIDEDDELIGSKLTNGEDELVIVTREGMSIRFQETDLRDQGRATRGVKGVTLKKADDVVKAIEVVDSNATLLIAGENGIGKRTDYSEYRTQSRGGSGIIALKTASKVAGALSVHEGDEIMMFTVGGQAVRSPVKDVRIIGRTTQGVRLINLAQDDRLIGLCRVVEVEDKTGGEEDGEDGGEGTADAGGEE